MKSLPSLVMAVAILLLTSAHVSAQSGRQAVVTATNVQVMAEPSFSAESLMDVAPGSQLRVLEVSGDWVRVFHQQQQGFVHSAFVSVTGSQQPTAAAPVQASPAPAQQVGAASAARVNGSGRALQAGDVGYKDPNMARIFGVILTGGGQFYTGNAVKGLALLGTAVGAAVIGGAISAATIDYDCTTMACDPTGSYAPLYAGYAVALAAWGYGWYTAPDDAEAYNVQQARQRYGSLPVQPIVAANRAGGVSLGLRIQAP